MTSTSTFSLNPPLPHHIKRRLLWLPDSARSMGIHIMAGRGSGKSRLMGRMIAWPDFLRGVPTIILDPNGPTIDNFLDKVIRQPKDIQLKLWPRVRYVDMASENDRVVPFPLYYHIGQYKRETLYEIAQRYITAVRLLDPQLQTTPILGFNALKTIAERTGMVLAALNCQISEALDLLDHPEEWEQPLGYVVKQHPQAAPAAVFFLRDYPQWRPNERELQTNAFRAKLSPFVLDERMRAMFGADSPGIDWAEVIRKRQIVLLDFRKVLDSDTRRFKMLWVFSYFRDFIKARGAGRHQPVSLIIDELTELTGMETAGQSVFAATLEELLNVLMRNYRIWLTIAHQELFQDEKRMGQALMTMGTQILGNTSDPDAAVQIAKQFFAYDPYAVKRYEPLYASYQGESYVIEERPIEYSIQEQQLLKSYTVKDQGLFQFLIRPAATEGDVRGKLRSVTIRNVDKGQWVHEELVARARERLSTRDSIPVHAVLTTIAERLPRLHATIRSYGNDLPPEPSDDDEEQYLREKKHR